MADSIAYLEAIVGADISSFRRGMSEVRGELTDTAGLGSGLVSLGQTLTLGLTLPIIGVGVAAIKSFADVDTAMRNTNSILGLSEDQFQALQDKVIAFGATTKEGATDAANALYVTASAGFSAADAYTVMTVAVRTAEAGLADSVTTTTALVSALKAYSAGADQAANYSDIITRSIKSGIGTMDEFVGSMAQATPAAAALGVNFQDLSASASFLTQRGFSYSNAFTSLNAIFTGLIKPSAALDDVFVKLGVSSGTELIQKFGGLQGALEAISSVSGTSVETLGQLFTNIRAERGAFTIFDAFPDYTKFIDGFGDAVDGATDRAHQEQVKSIGYAFDLLKSSVTSALDKIGEALAPTVSGWIKTLSDFFTTVSSLDPDAIANIVKLAIAIALIGPAMLLLGLALDNLPLLAVVGLLLLLKQAWDTNFLGIQDAVKAAIPNIDKGLNDLHLAVVTLGINLAEDWFNIKNGFNDFFGADFTKLIHDVFVGNWQGVLDDLKVIWIEFSQIFTDYVVNPITEFYDSQILPAIGNALSGIDPKKILEVIAGLGAFVFALILLHGADVVAALGTALGTVATSVQTLVTTGLLGFLLPLLPVIAVIVGLFWAWENNIGGVADRISELGKTLKKAWTTFQQIEFLVMYAVGDQEGAYALLKQMGIATPGGTDIPGTIERQPGATPPVNSGVLPPGWAVHDSSGDALGNGASPVAPVNSGVLPPGWSAHLPAPSSGANLSSGQIGIGAYGTQINTITIHTNDAQKLLTDLRAMGIDLRKRA